MPILFYKYGYGDNQDGKNGAMSYPLVYVRSGYFSIGAGRLYDQTYSGYFWSLTVAKDNTSYFYNIGGMLQRETGKNNSFSLRCVVDLAC